MEEHGGLALGLRPDSCVTGVFRPAGSKSEAQRALLAAAVARGATTIRGLGNDDDVRAALTVAAALAPLERLEPGVVRVAGRAPGSSAPAGGALEVGESGTLARLATAVLALATPPGTRWVIGARGTLLFRRSRGLFEALRTSGVELVRQNLPGTWPVELVAAVPPAELVLRDPPSSQEVSGLLLALAADAEARDLVVRGRIPSEPYVTLTRTLLARFQATVEEEPVAGERRFRVRGPLIAPETPLELEPDASSAAVALAAACLSGGELVVPGLTPDSHQGDVRIAAHLAAFGCETRFEAGGLRARGFPSRGATLDLAGEPDLAPVLAAVAAGAARRHGAASVLTGLGTLPGKESDRLGGLAVALTRLGFAVEATSDALAIAPGNGPAPGPIRLDPRGDHRMAFAFALLGLVSADVLVREPGCVAKSWTDFWRDLERLGARVATSD